MAKAKKDIDVGELRRLAEENGARIKREGQNKLEKEKREFDRRVKEEAAGLIKRILIKLKEAALKGETEIWLFDSSNLGPYFEPISKIIAEYCRDNSLKSAIRSVSYYGESSYNAFFVSLG